MDLSAAPAAPAELAPLLPRAFALGAARARALGARWDPADGAPVFTVAGRYTARGWTEWTQGFQYGAALLAGEGTGDDALVALGRARTLARMAPHLTHTGVHDHGFNNLSTYGHLRRLARAGHPGTAPEDVPLCELALRVSGAVQAARWTRTHDGGGFIHSFNGPHSLFVDTVRSVRVLMVAHQLGHFLPGENDVRHSLLRRGVDHLLATARHNVFYGGGRDAWDTPEDAGRTCHEAVFNVTDGRFRCPATQQGWSPFTTWTRGLAWAVLGFAEQLEFLATLPDEEFARAGTPPRADVLAALERAARATARQYIERATAADGIPPWDTGAPGLAALGDWRARPAEPENDHEPFDASAAAIAAQGLLRLGRHLGPADPAGPRATRAGLLTARTLLAPPYLSTDPAHEGLLLHSVYHRPNGWDHIPPGRRIPCGESSLWGDYHLLELALLLHSLATPAPYPSFFTPPP